jgi:DNA-binding LytR/AlgR family response regulator
MVTFAAERPVMRDLALGFAYWLAFLLALERIHRSMIVALDRVRAVESLGAGDARVRLNTGAELRLSRLPGPPRRGD